MQTYSANAKKNRQIYYDAASGLDFSLMPKVQQTTHTTVI